MEKTNTQDLSSKVMRDVVNFETVRNRRWMVLFASGIFIFLAGIFLTVILTYINLKDMQTWDLLTIVKEDPEVVSQYWQEVLGAFWEELPRGLLGGAVVSLIGLAAFWTATSGKRQTVLKRIKEVEKYNKKEIR